MPSEYTSDSKRVQGQITKAGPPHAAGCWSRPRTTTVTAPRSVRGSRPPGGQDPRVVQIAWRAQHRLHERWRNLGTSQAQRTVAIACARELAAFCWEAATLT